MLFRCTIRSLLRHSSTRTHSVSIRGGQILFLEHHRDHPSRQQETFDPSEANCRFTSCIVCRHPASTSAPNAEPQEIRQQRRRQEFAASKFSPWREFPRWNPIVAEDRPYVEAKLRQGTFALFGRPRCMEDSKEVTPDSRV